MTGMGRYVPHMPRDGEPIPAELHLRCVACGYELTGLTGRYCPECGTAFDPRETWLENERETWEYHFENVRSRWEYFGAGYVALAAVAFVALSFVNRATLLGVLLVTLGELRIAYSGGRGLPTRMVYATICVLWGLVLASR